MKRFCLFLVTLSLLSGCGSSQTSSFGAPPLASNANPAHADALDEPLVEVRQVGPLPAHGIPNLRIFYNGQEHELKGVTIQGQDRPTFHQLSYDYLTEDLLKAGCNSLRTYGSSYVFDTPALQAGDVKACFDLARNAKATSGTPFTVLVGINMGAHDASATGNKPGGDGNVNYNDPTQVADQYQRLKQTVDAILALDQGPQIGWCVGNEIVTTSDEATKANIYKAIDNIAEHIQVKRGSKLLVLTSSPNLSEAEIDFIAAHTSHLNCLGTNSYYGKFGSKTLTGFLDTVASSFAASHWNGKPWIITEYGSYTLGWTDIGVSLNGFNNLTLQSNSTENAKNYLQSYENYVKTASSTSGCLGGFVLSWEPPVYSSLNSYFDHMYAYKGAGGPFDEGRQKTPDRLGPVEAIRQAYGGTETLGEFPQIVTPADGDPQGLTCDFKATLNDQPVSPAGNQLTARVSATGSDRSSLSVQWYLEGSAGLFSLNLNSYSTACEELIDGRSGTEIKTTINTASTGKTLDSSITFTAPDQGNYRLRAIVRDNTGLATVATGNAATASVMFATQ